MKKLTSVLAVVVMCTISAAIANPLNNLAQYSCNPDNVNDTIPSNHISYKVLLPANTHHPVNTPYNPSNPANPLYPNNQNNPAYPNAPSTPLYPNNSASPVRPATPLTSPLVPNSSPVAPIGSPAVPVSPMAPPAPVYQP